MSKYYIRIFALIFACWFSWLPTYSLASEVPMSDSRQSLKSLTNAYGFFLGQERTLKRIEETYPDLQIAVNQARVSFDAALPFAFDKISGEIQRYFGDSNFAKLNSETENKFAELLDSQPITRELSLDFLAEIQNRKRGIGVDPEIWATILAANYSNTPVNEFLDGHVDRFSTDGTGKALGEKFTLKIPTSWKGMEGVRPRVLRKWISESGNGPNSVMVQVWSLDGQQVTEADIQEMIESPDTSALVPNGGNVVEVRKLMHENHPGVLIDYRIDINRVGIERNTRTMTYMIFKNESAIMLSCMTVMAEVSVDKIDTHFRPMKPLCRQVMNSLTFF